MTRLAASIFGVLVLAAALLLASTPQLPVAPRSLVASSTLVAGWTNVTSAVAPPAVGGGMMAYDSKADLFLLFGGDTTLQTNETWILNPKDAAWTQLHPAASPPARVDGMLVYDDHADAFILFGGWQQTGTYLYARYGDTWMFYLGNDTWIQRHPSTSPSPRSDSAIAYDPQDDLLLLFGGFNGTAYLGDGWSYDMASDRWTPVQNTVAPSRRADGRMTYDPRTGAFYLYGGNDYSGPNFTFHHLNDTWRYVERDHGWAELSPAQSPGARDYAVFASAPASGELLSFGGYGAGVVLGDLWAFNTTDLNWRNLTAPGQPVPRMAAVGGYSPEENVYVIFSGGDTVSAKDDTWFFHFPGPLGVRIVSPLEAVAVGVALTLRGEALGGSGLYSEFTWDFGDGHQASGQAVSHTYATTGVFSVNLRVTDSVGDASNASAEITVSGSLPTWALAAGAALAVGAGVAVAVFVIRRRRAPKGPG